MYKITATRAFIEAFKARNFVWTLLVASFGVAGQQTSGSGLPIVRSGEAPSGVNPWHTTPGPGSLPVLPPPTPVTGPSPWQMPGKERFYTDSDELKAFIEKSNKPDRKLEEFRVDMERSRSQLEQERALNKINIADYSKGIADYGKSINLYRDLKRQGLSGSR